MRVEGRVVLQVDLLLPLGDAVERRLRDVEVVPGGAVSHLARDHVVHLPVEEGQEQGADVAAVDVGVRHQDDLVVAQFVDAELVVDAGPDGGDHRRDLHRGEHLVEAGLLDVQDLAAQGKDRLVAAVAPLLGGAACRISFYDVEFAELRIALLAVGQLPRQ